MARTALTVQRAAYAGTELVFGAASADDCFVPQAGRALFVKNAAGAPITVTFPSVMTVHGLTVPDRVDTVTNGKTMMIGLGNTPKEHIQADGLVYINYSSTTTITVALVEID